MKTIVSLFDKTGTMVEPWAEAGHECWIVDIQHEKGVHYDEERGIHIVGADLRFHVPEEVPRNVDFVACFPPCTHLSISGARWMQGKGLRALAESVEMFATSAEYAENTGAPYFIENPMSTISTYWRPPDHKFHPAHYSGYHLEDNYTKETWLWVGNGFIMPPKDMPMDLFVDTQKIHYLPPSDERANIRSATPTGFAIAVYQAYGEKGEELRRKS